MSKYTLPCLLFVVALTNLSVSKPILGQYHDAMWFLKSEEGFSPTAYHDVKQYTNGWGTKAKFPGETVTLEEANARVIARYQEDYDYLRTTYPDLDEWTARVVSITRYNVGSFGKGMQKALRKNDTKKIAKWILKYNRVSGKVHPAIDGRRKREVRLLLEGSYITHELKTRDVVMSHILKHKS